MIKQFTLPAFIAGILLTSSAAQATNLVIDDYSDTGTPSNPLFCPFLGYDQCVFRNTPGLFENTQTVSSALGGSRSLKIGPEEIANASFGVNPGGFLQLSNAGAASANTLNTVTYDAGGAGLDINALNPDLTPTFDIFNLAILSADVGLDVTLELVSDLGGSNGTGSLTLNDVGGGSKVVTSASFDLLNPAFGAVDFGDIDRVTLTLFGDQDLDAEIDQIAFVRTPEPANTLGLLAMGGTSLILTRRKKQLR